MLGIVAGVTWTAMFLLWYGYLRAKGVAAVVSGALAGVLAVLVSGVVADTFVVTGHTVSSLMPTALVFGLAALLPLGRLWRSLRAQAEVPPSLISEVLAEEESCAVPASRVHADMREQAGQLAKLREHCQRVFTQDHITPERARGLLTRLEAVSAVRNDKDLFMLMLTLQEAVAHETISFREQESVRYWLGVVCGEQVVPPDFWRYDEGQTVQDDGVADPQEAYLLANTSLTREGRYVFDYRDPQGHPSTRQVDVLYVDGDYIDAFDHRHQSIQTFCKGRIDGKVTDVETGEVLAPWEMTRTRLGIERVDRDEIGRRADV